jgi:hypothetical protein
VDTYPLPRDKDEKARLKLADVLFYYIMDKKLYYAPVGKFDKVLDVGTGTGSWALNLGNTQLP